MEMYSVYIMWATACVQLEARHHNIIDYSIYLCLCGDEVISCDGDIKSKVIWFLKTWNTHTHNLCSHIQICTWHQWALGNTWLLTFIITRKRRPNGQKQKHQRKSEEVLLSGAQRSGPTFPVRDPRVTSRTFQHLKMQSRRLFSHWSLFVWVCVCMWVCVHSSLDIATITWQELYNYSLWSHFPQRPFWSFLCFLCVSLVLMLKWLTLNHPALLSVIPFCSALALCSLFVETFNGLETKLSVFFIL